MQLSDYDSYIADRSDKRDMEVVPSATVVIVTYNSGSAVLDLVNTLQKQTNRSFETAIINNGKIEQAVVQALKNEPLLYIENNENSVSLGRNIGAASGRGEIIIFLDDDCLAHENLIDAHVTCLEKHNAYGARGKALAKKKPFYHHYQAHYDLGPHILPTVIGLEGNCSLRKKTFIDVGGYNPDHFGAEGLDLSYRIVRQYDEPNAILYNPEAIIYHDYASGLMDYLEKCYRHPIMREKLVQQFPDIIEFGRKYGPYPIVKQPYCFPFEKFSVKCVGLMGLIAEKLGKLSA